LAAEIVSLFDGSTEADPIAWERVLHGIVAQAVTQPADLRAALTPLRDRPYAWSGFSDGVDRRRPERRLQRLIKSIVEDQPAARRRFLGLRWTFTRSAEADRGTPVVAPGAGPLRAFVARIEEIHLWLDSPPAPLLLATPTSMTGHIAPAVLVDRLAAVEAAARQPLPLDLEQALLRLPRELDEDALARARGLRSPAGRRLAEWLASGGLPDAPIERHPAAVRRRRITWPPTSSPDYADVVLVAIGPAPASGGALTKALHGCRPGDKSAPLPWFTTLWPAVAPSHREVIMAHLLPSVADAALLDERGGAGVLPLVAERTGPVGAATALGLAYGLAAKHRQDQTAAADALLALSAAGDLPASAVGAEIGALCAAGATKLTRVVAALDEVAFAGAAGPVWEIVAAALPTLLAAPDPPRGTPDLLQLAAKVAAGAGARTELATVAAVAARGGAGRLVVEARRLQRVLAGAAAR
jgi:hypothetical protein